MSPGPREDRTPLEDLVSAQLHGASVPDALHPDVEAAHERGRRVVRRRRVATAIGGAAAVVALGVGAVTLTPFGPQATPPATSSSEGSPQEGVVELTVGGQNGADTFDTRVRAAVRPRGSGGTVTFTHHDGQQWMGNARVTIPSGDGDAATGGDGAGGYLTYAVVHDEPTEVSLLDEEGRAVRAVDFAATPLPGTDRHLLVVTRRADVVDQVPTLVRWTAADGEVVEVPIT